MPDGVAKAVAVQSAISARRENRFIYNGRQQGLRRSNQGRAEKKAMCKGVVDSVWVAGASRALVSASRRNKLLKVRERETPAATRKPAVARTKVRREFAHSAEELLCTGKF